MDTLRQLKIMHALIVAVATLFGVATIVAGTRVLAGADPGYAVYRPLLIFNTAMGLAYVAAGVMAWRSIRRGKYAAGTIFVVNFLVLGATAYLYRSAGMVAVESVRAMVLRTVVWLLLFLGLAWMSRARPRPAGPPGGGA